MTTPDPRGPARRPGSLDEIRGYLSAAGDLSSIARARILDAARSAARTEIERAGGALGLAGAEETNRLRRTVERLERRVAALEGAGGPGSRPSSRPASRGAGRRPPAPRPGSTPLPARPGSSGPGSSTPGASAATGPSAGSRTDQPSATAAPAADAAAPDAPSGPTRSAAGRRPPVRRPTPAATTEHTPTAPGAGTPPDGDG